MSQAEWDAWVARHCDLFGLSADEDARRLTEWAALFDKAGYAPAELTEASEWLVTNAPPKNRSEHLPRLTERLRDQRLRAAAPAEQDWGSCVECQGTGRVCCPSLKALALGRWGTWAVACRCLAGRRFRERNPTWLTLEDYEAKRPLWRAEMKAHYALLRAEADAAGDLPAELAKVLSRLRKRAEDMRAAWVPLPVDDSEIPW